MEILQQTSTHRLILERIKGQKALELHERKTGYSQSLYFDNRHTMADMRKEYATIDIDKLIRVFSLSGAERIKLYKEGV